MKCTRAQNLFSDLVDQQLTAEVKADLLAHVADCGDCSEQLVSFTAAHRALETIAIPIRSAPVLAGVRARIAEEGLSAGAAKPWYRSWWMTPAPALAAAGVMIFMVMQSGPSVVDTVSAPAQSLATTSSADAPVVGGGANVAPDRQNVVAANPAPPVNVQPTPAPVVAGRSTAHEARQPKIVREDRRIFVPSSRVGVKERTSESIMTGDKEVERPVRPVSRVVVAAYEAPSRYSGNEDVSLSDQELSQVSVTKTYASDGSVRRVRIFVEGATEASVENYETPTSYPQERTDNKHLPAWVGRV